MREQSHLSLGRYLARNYLCDASSVQRKAFLIGCVAPDKNPATYLKGSLRYQWLRGHNYPNSKNYMARLSERLEHKRKLSLLDHYALGKLIHYTTDAFTFAHNRSFSKKLKLHRKYEARLQDHFLKFLSREPITPVGTYPSITEAISAWHDEYRSKRPTIETDSIYALTACSIIMSTFFSRPAQASNVPG